MIYIKKNILEHSVRAKTDNNLSDVSDVTDVTDVTDAVAIFLYCLFLCAEIIPFDFFQTYLAPKMDCNSTNEFPT